MFGGTVYSQKINLVSLALTWLKSYLKVHSVFPIVILHQHFLVWIEEYLRVLFLALSTDTLGPLSLSVSWLSVPPSRCVGSGSSSFRRFCLSSCLLCMLSLSLSPSVFSVWMVCFSCGSCLFCTVCPLSRSLWRRGGRVVVWWHLKVAWGPPGSMSPYVFAIVSFCHPDCPYLTWMRGPSLFLRFLQVVRKWKGTSCS